MTKKWFRIGIAGVFLMSLALRFWGLERFNTLVFDEVYFAKFGNNYLTHTPFFNAHPPLSQYIIGIGIWLGSHIPFWHDTVNGLTGSLRSPWTYRWFNALTGSFIPVVVAAIAYQLSYRRTFALLAGFFTACDGLFLVESRYALSNIYIVIFGLLGHWFLLLALENQNQRRWFWLVLAGINFGASVGTKWNGLWFLFGAYLLWVTAWIIQGIHSFSNSKLIPSLTMGHRRGSAVLGSPQVEQLPSLGIGYGALGMPKGKGAKGKGERLNLFLFPFPFNLFPSPPTPSSPSSQTPLQNLTQLNVFQILFFLGIIPAFIYSIIWIPHLQLDKTYGFIAVHQQILKFHLHLGGNSTDVHPYCAPWYKWPLMTRPMAYYYQTAGSINEPLPVVGPPLPSGAEKIIYDVHAMGNPFLWWFGVAAMLFLMGMLVLQALIPWVKKEGFSAPATLSIDTWIALYLVINYAANLLPWVKVTRCVFIYHYMCALVFIFLAIAWFVDRCLHSYYQQLRAVGVTITFIIFAALIFWMPVYLGLPLSPEDYRVRMWFRSWI
ncbi:MAG: phospholipid carrier-dependent glycosyltransferase [Nostoc sp. GBBB01]|jgi:dolichyl-phosphate-mannose--protein O-mannosyl transferase|nr:phospholipid carrier-dependent glycosyltransferase [Nostoc sp. GBBB01]